MDYKACTKCGDKHPRTSTFFGSDKTRADGLFPWCKRCKNAANKKRREENPEKVKAEQRAAYFKNHQHYLETNRTNWSKNREANLARRKVYCAENLEAIHAGQKRWYQRNKDAAKRKSRIYYQVHKVAIRPRLKATLIRHRRENPELYKVYRARRRASLSAAPGTHTAQDIKAQYKRQKGRCWWCTQEVGTSYHVDHLIALALGGSDGPENIVISCPRCNCSKGAKLPHEFMEGRLL